MADASGDLEEGAPADPLPNAGEWDQLADRTQAPPFLRPGWIAAWRGAFGGGELETIEVRRGTELAAVLPVQRRRGRLASPTNWHTPVFGPLGLDDGARNELIDRVFCEPETVVDLNLLDGDGEELESVAQAAREARRSIVARSVGRSPYISLEGDFDAYERTLSRNRRKALRRHRRKLEELGTVEFEVHTGHEGLDDLLEQVFAVEAAGWKGREGTAISSQAETTRFYTDVAHWAASRGWLRLALLRLEGRPIACDFAIEQGGVWYTLKAGYDEVFRSFGPGALLLRDEIAHCCELPGISRIELLGHEDSFKASWTDRSSPRTWLRAFDKRPAGLFRWAGAASWERARPGLRRIRRLADE